MIAANYCNIIIMSQQKLCSVANFTNVTIMAIECHKFTTLCSKTYQCITLGLMLIFSFFLATIEKCHSQMKIKKVDNFNWIFLDAL